MEDIHAKLAAAANVSEHHKILKHLVGNWAVTVKVFQGEGKPSLTSKAYATVKSILGGRFVEETYKGQHQGKPFEGRGLTGFDNVSQMYVASWVDTMGTSIMASKGIFNQETNTFIFEGEYTCPVTRQTKKTKSLLKIESPSSHTYEMYESSADGKETKNIEIIYKKKG